MTVDEGGEVMELELANTLPCRTNLGDRIFDSVESHPGRMVDQVETATRTCLIKTQMPKNSFKDVLMQIETGPVGITDLAQKLLPNSYQLMHWLLHDETSTYNPERPSQRCELEEGWVILRGASIAGIQWAFPMSICSAIESSQLRAWEVEHGIQDTECLMMRLKIARGKPCCAIFTLRLGFIQAVGLTQRIYS
jgi:hypothetical protein